MRRFRLLGLYVAGLVALIGLTVWAVSTRRLAADAGAPPAQEIGTEAPAALGQARSPVNASIANFVFEPKELLVTVGTTVTWVNADDVPHTVTSTASPPLFSSQALGTNDTFSFVFRTAGTYDYFCKLHPKRELRILRDLPDPGTVLRALPSGAGSN
jgi:plastocyanin